MLLNGKSCLIPLLMLTTLLLGKPPRGSLPVFSEHSFTINGQLLFLIRGWGQMAVQTFLAHLSQRLIGELIGYSWSGVRPSSSFTMLKDLLLQNRLPDQSQILCGTSLGRGNKSLLAASGSHDQDGRHDHI